MGESTIVLMHDQLSGSDSIDAYTLRGFVYPCFEFVWTIYSVDNLFLECVDFMTLYPREISGMHAGSHGMCRDVRNRRVRNLFGFHWEVLK